MNLANIGSSPLEIATAEIDPSEHPINWSVRSEPALELSLLRSYPAGEILAAAKENGHSEEFQEALPLMLQGKETTWRLWHARISPRLVTLDFYQSKGYDELRDRLKPFKSDVSLEIVDAKALGLEIRRPALRLSAEIEISSSGPNGTHTLKVAVAKNGRSIGVIQTSLFPSTE